MKKKNKTGNNKISKIAVKAIVRLCLFFIVFGTMTLYLSYNFFSNVSKFLEIKEETRDLEDKLVVLQGKEEELSSDIKKMEDPEYAARYAREKFMLTKDGELVLIIPD